MAVINDRLNIERFRTCTRSRSRKIFGKPCRSTCARMVSAHVVIESRESRILSRSWIEVVVELPRTRQTRVGIAMLQIVSARVTARRMKGRSSCLRNSGSNRTFLSSRNALRYMLPQLRVKNCEAGKSTMPRPSKSVPKRALFRKDSLSSRLPMAY